MTDSLARSQALRDIAAIARQHNLSAADIAAAVGNGPPAAAESGARTVLVRVLGVLGGTFVFAGIGVFIALHWASMNSAARVVVTLGSGIASFVLAALAYREERFDKAAA